MKRLFISSTSPCIHTIAYRHGEKRFTTILWKMRNQRHHRPLSNPLIFYACLHATSCHLKPFWAPIKSWEILEHIVCHNCIHSRQKQVQEKTRGKITGTRKFDGLSNCCPRPVGRALTLRYFNASLDFSAVFLRAHYQSLLSFKCNW